uniref:Uncharacterized protein n=1 Tax=Manihot esculenta TaxID=3983 RepID=A0A2C9VBR0_MANES
MLLHSVVKESHQERSLTLNIHRQIFSGRSHGRLYFIQILHDINIFLIIWSSYAVAILGKKSFTRQPSCFYGLSSLWTAEGRLFRPFGSRPVVSPLSSTRWHTRCSFVCFCGYGITDEGRFMRFMVVDSNLFPRFELAPSSKSYDGTEAFEGDNVGPSLAA